MENYSARKRLTSVLALAVPAAASLVVVTCLWSQSSSLAGLQSTRTSVAAHSPVAQSLTYRIQWHGVLAGTAVLDTKKADASSNWETDVAVESAGLVSRLYRVQDRYSVKTGDRFCPSFAQLDAQEGKKHTMTRLTFDNANHSVDYYEHDLIKNSDKRTTTPLAACTHEIVGALSALGQIDTNAATPSQIAVTDGKKMVQARIEVQGRESIAIEGKHYDTIRYQAFLFNNVLYKRQGRLFVWVTDDADRTAVQLRIELGFPVGDIYLQLDKQQKF